MSWKNLTIGKKIASGFGIILVLLCLVGGLSYTGVSSIVSNAQQVIDGNKLDGLLAQKEVDHLNWVGKVNALLADDSVTELKVQTDDHQCGFGQWLYGDGRKQAEVLVPSLASLFKSIEAPHLHLHESAIAIGKHFKQADPGLPALFLQREIDHLNWATKIRNTFLNDGRSLNVRTDPTLCGLGKWLQSDEARKAYAEGDAEFRSTWDQMVTTHHELHNSAKSIGTTLAHSPLGAKKIFEQETVPVLERTIRQLRTLRKKAEHKLSGMHQANEVYATHTIPALQQVQKLLKDLRQEARRNIMTDEVMLNSAQKTQRNVTIVGSLAVVAGILLAFFLARGIVKVLRGMTDQMEEGAEQVSSASGQVSSASQALAEGASEQAASIEETSSALEEMAAMTRQNADNANQANSLMKEANQVVDKANQSMQDLTSSMGQITEASEETSKIIKTIDEIAFQTNLLALNAAVEAARAGEAGAGFAVVADEVRNLAMRAADAAKNTSELIEGTVKKVEDGSGLVTQTNDAFSRVAEDVGKVSELVGEINAASNEQAQGIGQVNQAVTEMDKVTQQNAASAEESASASEEMNAQAIQMKSIVDQLMVLVGGANGHIQQKMNQVFSSGAPAQQVLSHGNNGDGKPGDGKASRARGYHPAISNGSHKKPEEVIPLDEDDFQDF